MVIVTGGMHRSGTTWLYNVLRSIYPYYNSYFFDSSNINFSPQSIIKAHEWHESFNGVTSIRIVRDLRSVAASLLEFEPLKTYYKLDTTNIVDHLSRIVHKESEDWREQLLIKYEDTKLANVKQIKNFLNIDIDEAKIVESVENIKHPKENRDLVTEFWPGHITNSKYQNLPVSTIKYIESKFDWWFKKYGYF